MIYYKIKNEEGSQLKFLSNGTFTYNMVTNSLSINGEIMYTYTGANVIIESNQWFMI